MNLEIDFREHKLLAYIGNTQDLKIKPLVLGDFRIYTDTHEILIERKTWTDVRASIRDGRFREQRSRLLLWRSESSERQIIYIVEGKFDNEFLIEKQAMYRLMIGYSIPLFFTETMEQTWDTVSFISTSDSDKFFRTRSIEQDQIEARFKGVHKKNYENAKLFFLQILFSIRGISSPMAIAIGEHFQSCHEFFRQYQDNPQELEQTLSDIRYVMSGNKEKKLTKSIIQKILNYLGCNKNEILSEI